ncbi:MAG: hypothetical protein KAS32_19510 [Candidatus Peribacteraceae bacterium]|nr:hypothetical protein [Candidatus Peribacteraceae bacterium]
MENFITEEAYVEYVDITWYAVSGGEYKYACPFNGLYLWIDFDAAYGWIYGITKEANFVSTGFNIHESIIWGNMYRTREQAMARAEEAIEILKEK